MELNKIYKSVLITGGAQRIGESIACYLANNGLNIAIQFNKSQKKAQELKNRFKNKKTKFLIYKFDFEKNTNISKFYKNIINEFGHIDILINNASTFDFDTISSSNLNLFEKHINVNLRAPFFLSQNFVKHYKKQGLIINIVDQRVNNITPYFTSYTVSKVALAALTKSLALSLAPKIRVNAISPGPTLMSTNQNLKQFRKQVLRTPLKKQVELSEINNAVSYLINNRSVTGETLTLDSGQSLGCAHSKSNNFKLKTIKKKK